MKVLSIAVRMSSLEESSRSTGNSAVLMHPVPLETQSDIDFIYAERERKFTRLEDERRSAFDFLGNVRLFLFIGTLVSLGLGAKWSGVPTGALIFFISGLCGIVISVVLAVLHRRIEEELARAGRMRHTNGAARQRLKRRWSEFPVPRAVTGFADLPESHDLDLFGEGSLFQLLCITHSPQGRRPERRAHGADARLAGKPRCLGRLA